MNDTPQGDGNNILISLLSSVNTASIRMNDTPQGDGNYILFYV